MTEALQRIGEGLRNRTLAPYLGAGVLRLCGAENVPASLAELAASLSACVAVPGRIRGNIWAMAQYIETKRHRMTLVRHMQKIFAPEVAPSPFHLWLAGLHLPLIVDAWYDGAMSAALTAALGAADDDWGTVQAVTRNGKYEDIWYRFRDGSGAAAKAGAAKDWKTLYYKPLGSVVPHCDFLLSDSDFVEVLTEIDIQTPIPARVQRLRSDLGFVFFGCRFAEQTDRIFAREILKRSAGPHYAILDAEPTRNEARFLDEMGIVRIGLPLAAAAQALCRAEAVAA